MSCGIIIIPKVEDFGEYSKLNIVQLHDNIKNETRLMANKFNELRALALCTPNDVFKDNAYDRIKTLVDYYFEDYIESFKIRFNLYKLVDLETQKHYIGEDALSKEPYLYFNDFYYSDIAEAEEYLNEDLVHLSKIKSKILGLCLATPIDITPRDQVQYVDGHEEPIYYLDGEMNSQEESMDECLETICNTEFIIKHWDERQED